MHTPHPWRGIRKWKRHGLVLMAGGAIYICTGFSFIFGEQTHSTLSALQYATDWWSLQAWGLVFVISGCLAVVSSRWPPISERWGYAVMTGLSSGWAAFYLAAVVFADPPHAPAIRGMLIWGFLGFVWWAVSGLVNPPSKKEVETWTSLSTPEDLSQ